MPYRFVHAADIHLDSPLRSLALRDPELADLIGTATRHAFTSIITLCLDEQVDALILAGDLYDGDQTSMKTARFLAEQLRRLDEGGIRVFIIRGNHDAESRITKELSFPDSVKLFRSHAEAIITEPPGAPFRVAVHGMSFAQTTAPHSLLPRYKPPVADALNIGLMHTSLGGSAGHDNYAPCSIADLDAAGFDYWALGHIHQRAVEKGRCTIVMPGIPQGRDIGEDGPKSVTLVTIADDRGITLEERHLALVQFERISLDLSGVATWPDLQAAIGQALRKRRQTVPADHMVARLRLTGASPLAWQLRRDRDLLMETARGQADVIGDRGLGASWIEKIEIDCRPPDGATDTADPVIDLRRLIEQDIIASPAYRAEIEDIVSELRDQLPRDSRTFLGADEDAFEQAVATLVTEGAEDVLARLQARAADEPA